MLDVDNMTMPNAHEEVIVTSCTGNTCPELSRNECLDACMRNILSSVTLQLSRNDHRGTSGVELTIGDEMIAAERIAVVAATDHEVEIGMIDVVDEIHPKKGGP